MPRKRPEDLEPAYEETITRTRRSDVAPEESEKSYDVEIETDGSGHTKKIKLDLEVDASAKDLGVNPFARWIHLARAVDAWRPFPRLFIAIYIYILYRVIEWYISLPDPTMEQSGLISVVVGAGAAWFGLYVGSGSKK